MILSVSRRTDIPAFYSEWFFNRLKEGYIMVRNPMNKYQVSKINLESKNIDCIVFWTKNPEPILNRLEQLEGINYYFQFTINPYGKDIEPNVPEKSKLLSTFIELSQKIGKEKVVWRYDPIFLTDDIDVNYHIKYFEKLSERLRGYTNTVVISILDEYVKTKRNMKGINIKKLNDKEIDTLFLAITKIAKNNKIEIKSCAEEKDLQKYGITHGKCIDDNLISKLFNFDINIKKDKNQRKSCGCVESIEVGAYNTCLHGCKYCYANFDDELVENNYNKHDKNSPFLIGNKLENDEVTERKIKVLKRVIQEKLF